jgi:hypothetical protein
MNTDDLARINESYKMIADIPGKFEGAQAFLAEGFTFKETYYNPLHTHNTGDLVQELREALIKFTIEKIAENTNYTINTKEVTDYINGTLGRSGFDAVAIKDYVNKHYKAKEDELSLIEIKKGVNSLTPNFWKDYRHRTPELSDLVKKNTLTLRCWLNWSYHWDYHGFIKKINAFEQYVKIELLGEKPAKVKAWQIKREYSYNEIGLGVHKIDNGSVPKEQQIFEAVQLHKNGSLRIRFKPGHAEKIGKALIRDFYHVEDD